MQQTQKLFFSSTKFYKNSFFQFSPKLNKFMLISIILTFLLLINNKNSQVYATQEQQQFSRQVRPYSERAANQNLLDGSMSMDEFDNTDPFYRAARENGVKWMRFGKRVPQQSKWMRFGKRAPSSGKWMRFGKRNSEFMEEK
ncbi:unnamed protein product [Meloidogyne enterolobii]|uniref:Uncharacterized protein n=1 Tax=Meloidogyne enterolobii TaxID=390850 RepID=A0ACB1ATY9_MELEN